MPFASQHSSPISTREQAPPGATRALQGISPFCLAVDRQAASYLPTVFGAHHDALRSTPGPLPTELLDWMQRPVRA